jgi:hypothetical protein
MAAAPEAAGGRVSTADRAFPFPPMSMSPVLVCCRWKPSTGCTSAPAIEVRRRGAHPPRCIQHRPRLRHWLSRAAAHALLRTLPTIVGAVLAGTAGAQAGEVVHRAAGDAMANSYLLHPFAGRPRALLVLLPGYGGDVRSFTRESAYTPSTLPERLAGAGVLTVTAVPDPETLFATEAPLARLDSIVAEVVRRFGVAPHRVAVGGFSAGGTGAVRYAQRCAAGGCTAVPGVAAVFGVDPPLDFERLYRSAQLIVRRGAPRSNLAEERWLMDALETSLGGGPDAAPDAYHRASPLLASRADGGNARWLAQTPIRLYTEPDVHWWMEERDLDYSGMNAMDHAALVNLLRVAGNDRAELITTRGRGYRPDGRRHPHSWSIVDEAELADWLVSQLLDVDDRSDAPVSVCAADVQPNPSFSRSLRQRPAQPCATRCLASAVASTGGRGPPAQTAGSSGSPPGARATARLGLAPRT